MSIRNKFDNSHEGQGKNEKEIAEVLKFHAKRIMRETIIEAKKESSSKPSSKPSGDCEYEQLIAEDASFNTKPMIREAAFFIAKRRGFAPGSEMSDWLEAESEVEDLLRSAK